MKKQKNIMKQERNDAIKMCKEPACPNKDTAHSHSSSHKSDTKILIAFLLNFGFAVFEFVGGFLSASVAISSDALHDMGDALSIGISWLLERQSKKSPDDVYTFGRGRYSVLGALITYSVLLTGSVLVIIGAVKRLMNPVEADAGLMMIFAVVGIAANLVATFITARGESLNQKAINLHMLEDVSGWAVVLLGALIMKFTGLWFIDPLMSIGVSLYMIYRVIRNLLEIADLFLVRVPRNVNLDEVKENILSCEGVSDVHHIHLWSLTPENVCATFHLVTESSDAGVKEEVKEKLLQMGITHVTMEIEAPGEHCHDTLCTINALSSHSHHHHHHHH